MEFEPQTIRFLMWATTVLGGGLIATLAWIALDVIQRLKRLQDDGEAQFKAFGLQLNGLHDLVMQDLHKHDVRIVRLEEWRKSHDRTLHDEND